MDSVLFARLVAFQSLRQVFAGLRELPWEFNARAGVLRIGDEPIVVPRAWLQGADAARTLAEAMRRARDALTDHPLRIDGECGTTLRLWSSQVSLEDYEEAGRFVTWRQVYQDTPDEPLEWALDEDERKVTGDLEHMMVRVLRKEFAAFTHGDGEDHAVVHAMAADIAPLMLEELLRRMPAGEFRDAVCLLASPDRDLARDVIAGWGRGHRIIRRMAGLLHAEQAAQAWPAAERHLARWLPMTLSGNPALLRLTDTEHAPDHSAEHVVAWLRAQGLPGKAVPRLRHLPAQAVEAMIDVWALHVPQGWRHAMQWLGHLVAALGRARERALPLPVIVDAARAAAIVGVLRDRREEVAGPRWAFVPREMGASDWPQDAYLHDMACEETIPYAIADTFRWLHGHEPGSADTFAHTLLHAYLEDAGVTPDDLRTQLPDTGDWIRELSDGFAPWGTRLTPAQLGPRWSVIQRGQARWHETFHVRRQAYLAQRERELHGDVRQHLPKDCAWDPACDAFALGDLEAVPLATSAALAEEGRRMQHCVAGYTGACLQRGHRIFSIRRLFDGESLATAEFAPVHDGWRLVQLRGWRNAACTAAGGAVLEPWVDIVAALTERLVASRRTPARRAA